jgi:hypothetical protein
VAETKLTKPVTDIVLGAVAAGLPLKFAALKAGIAERTLYRWLRAGRAATKGAERQFCHDLKRAQAESVEVRIARLGEAAAKGAWQADCWWLERMFPDEFSANRNEVRELLRQNADLAARIQALEARRGGTGDGAAADGEADPADGTSRNGARRKG